jgi:hypothetical protein
MLLPWPVGPCCANLSTMAGRRAPKASDGSRVLGVSEAAADGLSDQGRVGRLGSVRSLASSSAHRPPRVDPDLAGLEGAALERKGLVTTEDRRRVSTGAGAGDRRGQTYGRPSALRPPPRRAAGRDGAPEGPGGDRRDAGRSGRSPARRHRGAVKNGPRYSLLGLLLVGHRVRLRIRRSLLWAQAQPSGCHLLSRSSRTRQPHALTRPLRRTNLWTVLVAWLPYCFTEKRRSQTAFGLRSACPRHCRAPDMEQSLSRLPSLRTQSGQLPGPENSAPRTA